MKVEHRPFGSKSWPQGRRSSIVQLAPRTKVQLRSVGPKDEGPASFSWPQGRRSSIVQDCSTGDRNPRKLPIWHSSLSKTNSHPFGRCRMSCSPRALYQAADSRAARGQSASINELYCLPPPVSKTFGSRQERQTVHYFGVSKSDPGRVADTQINDAYRRF
ncbi:hypothetical protein LSAT2_030387 [Lamellibrachia satsuma]|nr:hypothetical protein LSAT2_030387 [Lamellibrachia satsuma]